MFCSKCGKELNKESKFCRFCGSNVLTTDVQKHADKSLESLEKQQVLGPASRNKRFINFVLDTVGYYIFGTIVYIILPLLFGDSVYDNFNDFVLGISIVLFYFILFESIWGKTPAKFITRTKVIFPIGQLGQKPNTGHIVTRSLVRLIPFEPFSFISSKNPIGWHDSLSKTIVVDESYEMLNDKQ